jgi:hypothetical protein
VRVDGGHLDEGGDGEQHYTWCAAGVTQLEACGGLAGGAQVRGSARLEGGRTETGAAAR